MTSNDDTAGKPPSHTEIWDDTELVQAWDQALAEYKKYHSIEGASKRTKNENIKISQAADSMEVSDAESGEIDERIQNNPSKQSLANQTNIPAQFLTTDSKKLQKEITTPRVELSADHSECSNPQQSTNDKGIDLPAPLKILANEDESLRNLMMSWYYAGYYTGYHAGQKSESKNNENL
ncbi:Survival motor neuron-like protein 1 [Neolecta irregularis DAH-3]|uniref:Survival motor neuron-like protein 1 n=1 Tax=Neolecta irregularis (strain DAH-3) TaxID=1198029 RepID=A0A1U7LTB9_NEOID|nr:Survival motor neuron-like protein 1 [Neolecta irregularis DAH-3]|eukprot:OLL25907.1 Survival motor neuron-like protein 1 [Neolecta irregularis DAH-3]